MPRYISKKKILNYKPKRGMCHANFTPEKNLHATLFTTYATQCHGVVPRYATKK
jgi:hypothetical protein